MNQKNIFKSILFILWIILIGSIFYLYWTSDLSAKELPTFIRDGIAGFGIWGPIFFIVFYVLRTLTFFSATVFTIAAGLLFPPFWAVVYVLIAVNLSTLVAFFAGRYFGSSVIAHAGERVRFFPKGEKFRKQGFISVLLMRLLFFPFDWVGYLGGAYAVRMRDVFLGTLIGTPPGTIAFVYLGGALNNPLRSLPIFLVFFALGLVIAKYLKKTNLGKELEQIKKQGE